MAWRDAAALTWRHRAFSLPKWTIVAHALLWFFGLSALWITHAAISGECAKLTATAYPFPPPGVRLVDLAKLRVTNYTQGAASSTGVNFTQVFWNATATALYAAQVEKARTSVLLFAACEARLSPTLGGVFFLTLATLLYGAWRRGQLRRMFNLPGSKLDDYILWVFCSCCTLCQEYRTLRLANVEFGQWGGNVGWLLDADGDKATATVKQPPPDVEMSAGLNAAA